MSAPDSLGGAAGSGMQGVGPDYYRRLREAESHWWQRGMWDLAAAVLGDRLDRRGQALLDAGCGTGGFLAWVAELGVFDRLCGVEISLEAIEAARAAAPRAELHVARLDALPFDAETFDLVVMNDVLQHVHEDEVTPGLSEVRRVLRPAGALFVRTNGARRARREREDWRVYDAATLERELTAAGLAVKRITYANTLFSLWGSVRGRTPRAPTETWAGHPQRSGKLAAALGRRVLAAEARYLRDTRRRLPYGHTLLAVAVRLPGDDSMPADPPSAR